MTLPPTRTKTKREHVLPLPLEAVAILQAVPRHHGPYIFSTDGQKPFRGWGRAAKTIRRLADLAAPWTIHDLRRSFATGLGEHLHTDEALIARLLNHSPRARLGVTSRYEKSRRLGTMRSALDSWARFITEAAEGRSTGAEVLTLATKL
jgi:integrase